MPAAALGGLLLVLTPAAGASQEARSPAFFEPQALKTIGLIAAHIIPTDQTPGAKGSDVVLYIDAEVTRSASLQKIFSSGLRELEETSRGKFGRAFAEATFAQQEEILKAMEKSAFFKALRSLTAKAFYNSPAGFRSVGFPGPAQPRGHRDFDRPPGAGATAAGPAESLPEGQGKKEVEAACSQCHELSVVTAERRSLKEWRLAVEEMVRQYHAPIEPDVAEKISRYLGRNFGVK